jgi:hypothetical protein
MIQDLLAVSNVVIRARQRAYAAICHYPDCQQQQQWKHETNNSPVARALPARRSVFEWFP